MNILVTGASGFIGSSLVNRLVREGHSVIALRRQVGNDESNLSWFSFDISKDKWSDLNLPAMQAVFHLAGQTSVYRARENPVEDLNVNVVGFVRMLDYFRSRSIISPFIMLAGTVTQVGITKTLPVSNQTPDKPITFYDVGKLTAELYLKQYINEGFLRGCMFRLTNVFGKASQLEDSGRSVLDHVFHAAMAGKDVQIYGEGNYLRDYVHISDVVEAFVKALSCFDRLNGNTYYLGTGIGTTVKQAFKIAVDLASRVTGKVVNIEHTAVPPGLNEIEFRNTVVDISPYTQVTGWTPRIDIEQGLKTDM